MVTSVEREPIHLPRTPGHRGGRGGFKSHGSRIRYTVLNPAAARLVDQYEDWPGLLITPWINSSMSFSRLDRRELARAKRKGAEPDPAQRASTPPNSNVRSAPKRRVFARTSRASSD
ncbi:MAG: hypothetical protein HYV07_05985 [Deltaproteobacteria bacterium]|nr:hypothetical protein [Deltaproteobacteria bacterium]